MAVGWGQSRWQDTRRRAALVAAAVSGSRAAVLAAVPGRLPIMPYFITQAAIDGGNCTWSPPAAWAPRGAIPYACLSSLHRFT